MKKAIRITLNVITYTFIALCVLLIAVTFLSKRNDGAINVFGYQARIVVSESMEKCDATDVSSFKIKDIPLKSMVFIECVPENKDEANEWYKNLQVGDVVTFRYKYDRQETITHRIIEKKENLNAKGEPTGGYTFTMQGDNKNLSNDPNASAADLGSQVIKTDIEGVNYIIGKVVGNSLPIGFVVYSIKNPIVMACIIIIPSAIILIFEIIKIIGILGEDKKKKAQEEKQKQEDEIEALKKQLEELKKLSAENSDSQGEANSEETVSETPVNQEATNSEESVSEDTVSEDTANE